MLTDPVAVWTAILLLAIGDVQTRLSDALRRYAATGQGDVTKLKGGEGARLRWGDYRVIFVETADSIEIHAIGHRRDIYR